VVVVVFWDHTHLISHQHQKRKKQLKRVWYITIHQQMLSIIHHLQIFKNHFISISFIHSILIIIKWEELKMQKILSINTNQWEGT